MNDVIKAKIKVLIDNKLKFPKSLDTILFIVENILDVHAFISESIQRLCTSHR